MRILKNLFVALLLLVSFQSLSAREKDTIPSIFKDDLLFTEVNPVHPFGIFTLDHPFYIGTFNKKGSKFTVGYSRGNNWHPQSTVYYPEYLNTRQRIEVNSLYMTQRPYYFFLNQIPVEYKTFSSDGVLQNLSFTYLWQLGKKGSFIFKLNTHLLSGGTAAIHHLASDDFIEWFHDRVGLHDNFGRYQYIFDRAHIAFKDENNESIRIDEGDTFLGTLDLHYYRPLWRTVNPASYHTFQLGAHIALPLNKYYQKVAGGISGAFLYRKKFSPGFYADLGVDFQITHHSLVSLKETVNIIDHDFRSSAKSYLSFNFVSKKDRVFYFGVMNNYQDSFLDGYIFSHSQDKYDDLGVAFLQPGEVWEGFEVKEQFKHAKLTAASMYFFSVKSYIFMGFKAAKGDFSFNVGEDYFSVNNAPDIQYGFQYTRTFGK
ncbi:MAG TPA: hypothetical protein DIW50_05645 [Prolixibacteraceae bacterium]|nr:hypothetical protein [Prolixibacteraceae bacterium]